VRRVFGLIALAAATAVALVPSPAGAESAADCYARLNAVRAASGLPRASAGTLPALARAAASHAAYRVNVDPGDDPLVQALPDRGPFGPDATAHQETSSLRPLGFTGVNPWDRTKAAGLKAGSWRYQFEDVVTADGTAASLDGVRSWVDAPYHRFPLLDVNTRHVGCAARSRTVAGRSYAAEVLEMAATREDQAKRLTVYPAPSQTQVPVSFNRLQEHPTPFPGAAASVGYVVSLQASGYHALKVQGMALSRGAEHAPVAIHAAVRSLTRTSTLPASAVDSRLPANAAMLAAKAPLAGGTVYHVRISGYVQATAGGPWSRFRTRAWSFTTA
jgi:Cysteine-rich secretory protein family